MTTFIEGLVGLAIAAFIWMINSNDPKVQQHSLAQRNAPMAIRSYGPRSPFLSLLP